MLEEYKQMLISHPTEKEVQTDFAALKVLSYLGKPDRKLFTDFFDKSDRKNPYGYIREYLETQSASPIGLRMGDQIKEVTLRKTRPNFHKMAMLGAVGQAYFDLCLVASLSQYCIMDTGVDLPYDEYISFAEKAVDICFKELEQLCSCLSKFKFNWHQGYERDLVEQYNSGRLNKSIVLSRIKTAVEILLLWEKDQIKYGDKYESILKSIGELSKADKDKVFFSHVVTVLRNKSDFTQEQMSFVNEAYENRFTTDQQKALLSNVPEVTPSVEDTQAYFFKSTEKKTTSIFDVDFGAVAE